jgi:hypothetical protein
MRDDRAGEGSVAAARLTYWCPAASQAEERGMTEAIDVREPTGDSWTCFVTVTGGGTSTNHAVSMTSADLARYAPGGATPDDLVRRSFEFLLARESKDSILRQFDLPVIGRYFSDYEAAITRRR